MPTTEAIKSLIDCLDRCDESLVLVYPFTYESCDIEWGSSSCMVCIATYLMFLVSEVP